MDDLTPEQLSEASPLAWVLMNNFVNENDKPLEFNDHAFLIEPFNDLSPDMVCIKSAQIGFSVMTILKVLWLNKYLEANVGYVLPTQNIVADFVAPKVNPLINKNPEVAKMVHESSRSLKQVGDRFTYFRGAFSEREAIAISLDILILDELDRMPDMTIVNTYDSRLQASEFAWRWRFSNPSIPSYGVHELWQDSDQMHWFVECPHCHYVMYMDFEKDNHQKNHYVDQERRMFACGVCHKELTREARRTGDWVAKFPSRKRRGYWISNLIAPWVTADRILDQKEESSIDFFHNFVLGKAYQPSEFLINRGAILRANQPMMADKSEVMIGCDSGKTKHYVIGNAEGVFSYGKTESWADIKHLIDMHNATTVIDALPDFTVPEQLARDYPGQVFVNYYIHDTKNFDVARRKEGTEFGVIQSDRTKLFDLLASDVSKKEIKFFQDPQHLDDLIYHLENMYRMVEVDTKGIERARWHTKENKPDHWAHALAYYRLAKMLHISSLDSGGVRNALIKPKKTSPKVTNNRVPVEHAIGMPMETLIERSINKSRRKVIK